MPRTVTQMQDIPKNDDFLAASARFVGKTRVYPDEAEEECEAVYPAREKRTAQREDRSYLKNPVSRSLKTS